MTPEQITGLATLIVEFREWLRVQAPGSLDELVFEYVLDLLAAVRSALVAEEAR